MWLKNETDQVDCPVGRRTAELYEGVSDPAGTEPAVGPDVMLVVGEINSTAACAWVGTKKSISATL